MSEKVSQVLQIFVRKEPPIASGFYMVGTVSIFVYRSPDYEKDGLLLIVAEGEDNTTIQIALTQFISTEQKPVSSGEIADISTMIRTLVGLSRKFSLGIEINPQIEELKALSRPRYEGTGVPLPLEMFGMDSEEDELEDG